MGHGYLFYIPHARITINYYAGILKMLRYYTRTLGLHIDFFSGMTHKLLQSTLFQHTHATTTK